MTYEDLINDLSVEVGGRSEVVSRLPQFVKQTEDFLWPLLEVYGTECSDSVTVTAGATSVSVSDTNWLCIKAVLDSNGDRLDRVPKVRIDQYNSLNVASTLSFFAWHKDGNLYVAASPSSDSDLSIYYLARQDYLAPGDTDATKFFLGNGYSVLKYAVLSFRVFDPERWPAWKQQYERELNRLYVQAQTQNLTYKGPTDRRWF